ncbi:PEP-CTERM sorting domain-containing protein [Kiritimatiellaeota bacterium B1221]|nr:PEP-CTERM sorting domain-containing protein [Kiritimatiellaeota bacterium B1221]
MNKFQNDLKNTLSALGIAGTFLVCSTAQAASWNSWTNGSGDGLWETAANWSKGTVANGYGDAPVIGQLATAGPVTAGSGTYAFDYFRLGMEATQHPVGTLNVTGASLTSGGTNTRVGIGYGSGTVGILNLSQGSFGFLSSNTSSAVIGGNSGSGTVNQTGGSFSFAGGSATAISVSMGSTNGTGLYNFTAGTLETREAFKIATGGSGSSIFHVEGYDASSSIQIGGTSDDYNGAWLQGAGTTLSLSLDGGTAQGTTRINVDTGANGTHTGEAIFEAGSILDLDFMSGTQSAGTWTVLTAAGGITDNGLVLGAGVDTDVWSFLVDGNDLKIIAVPEPSSIALVMIVGGALLMTRRRKV